MNSDDTQLKKDLGKKAVKGSIWLSGSSLLTRFLGAFRLLILAALLPQTELGLFGIAIVVMRLIEQLSQTGMRQALIQREGNIDDYLGTAWIAQITRGICIGMVLFLAASPIEGFFEKDGVAELLRWLAVVPILQGFFNIGFVHLNRELKFNRVVFHTTVVSITNFVFTILLSLIWPFALSLVFGNILSKAVGIVLSFCVESRRGTFHFSMSQFQELYKFGFWIFISAILSFTMVSGGDLIIGKVLTTESLAIYQVAYSLACIPLMQMVAVIGTTMYSVLSRIQNDHPRLVLAFLRIFALTCMLSAASVAGFAALGPLFTSMFLKPEYAMVSSLLPILAVWGASRALGSINSVLFQATGRPALATIFQLLMVVLFAIFIFPLTNFYGLIGLAWGLVGVGTISHIGRCILLTKILNIRMADLVVRLALPVVVGLVAYVGCTYLIQILDDFSTWCRLLVGSVFLVLTYTIGTVISELVFDFGILSFLSKHIRALDRMLKMFHLKNASDSLKQNHSK